MVDHHPHCAGDELLLGPWSGALRHLRAGAYRSAAGRGPCCRLLADLRAWLDDPRFSRRTPARRPKHPLIRAPRCHTGSQADTDLQPNSDLYAGHTSYFARYHLALLTNVQLLVTNDWHRVMYATQTAVCSPAGATRSILAQVYFIGVYLIYQVHSTSARWTPHHAACSPVLPHPSLFNALSCFKRFAVRPRMRAAPWPHKRASPSLPQASLPFALQPASQIVLYPVLIALATNAYMHFSAMTTQNGDPRELTRSNSVRVEFLKREPNTRNSRAGEVEASDSRTSLKVLGGAMGRSSAGSHAGRGSIPYERSSQVSAHMVGGSTLDMPVQARRRP